MLKKFQVHDNILFGKNIDGVSDKSEWANQRACHVSVHSRWKPLELANRRTPENTERLLTAAKGPDFVDELE